MSRQSCAVCAWRATCNKKFCVSDGGAHCPDFSRDISIKDVSEAIDNQAEPKGSSSK